MIEVGVARPMAQGQAMIRTATAATSAAPSDGPSASHRTNVITATTSVKELVTASTGEFKVDGDGNATVWIDDLDPTDGIEIGLLQLAYDAEADAFGWFVAVSGESAGSVVEVELSIKAVSGAEPLLEQPTLPLHREWREWVQTFEAKTPISEDSPATITVDLLDADKMDVDSVGATGATGTMYRSAGFGKGTESSTSQASTKPQLL